MSGPWGWFMTRDYVASRSETGGEGGIRTLGRALWPYDGLANRCFRPLSHLSGGLLVGRYANIITRGGHSSGDLCYGRAARGSGAAWTGSVLPDRKSTRLN